MPLPPGTKLGPFEIVGPLGIGGMGEVYRARDTRLGRDVAIKILPKEMSADPARRQRFEREAKTISGLNNRGPVSVPEESHGGLFSGVKTWPEKLRGERATEENQ